MFSPQPIDTESLFSTKWGGFSGPAIEVSHRYGGTSGRFAVAEIIARVFRAYKSFVTNMQRSDPGAKFSFAFGPYPKDALTFKGKDLVEYKTPPQSRGFGNIFVVKEERQSNRWSGDACRGRARSRAPVRAAATGINRTRPVIVHQVERDVERSNRQQ
jgi:hypothetical protein